MSPSEELISELSFLKNSRKYYRTKVTKASNFVHANLDSLSLELIHDYINELKSLTIKLDKCNDSIGKIIWKCECTEVELQTELSSCDDYENKITIAVRRLETSLQTIAQNVNTAEVGVAHGPRHDDMVSTKLKLPMIPLPEFSNSKGESFNKFITSFEFIIDKYNISNYEKFLFLEKQVANKVTEF